MQLDFHSKCFWVQLVFFIIMCIKLTHVVRSNNSRWLILMAVWYSTMQWHHDAIIYSTGGHLHSFYFGAITISAVKNICYAKLHAFMCAFLWNIYLRVELPSPEVYICSG